MQYISQGVSAMTEVSACILGVSVGIVTAVSAFNGSSDCKIFDKSEDKPPVLIFAAVLISFLVFVQL